MVADKLANKSFRPTKTDRDFNFFSDPNAPSLSFGPGNKKSKASLEGAEAIDALPLRVFPLKS